MTKPPIPTENSKTKGQHTQTPPKTSITQRLQTDFSASEGKGPCAIVPLTWKMAHKSLCRMLRNGPLKISKSLKKAENGPFGKNLFPITAT